MSLQGYGVFVLKKSASEAFFFSAVSFPLPHVCLCVQVCVHMTFSMCVCVCVCVHGFSSRRATFSVLCERRLKLEHSPPFPTVIGAICFGSVNTVSGMFRSIIHNLLCYCGQEQPVSLCLSQTSQGISWLPLSNTLKERLPGSSPRPWMRCSKGYSPFPQSQPFFFLHLLLFLLSFYVLF